MLELLKKHQAIFKFLFTGGTAAAISLTTLYVLTEYFNVWYLASSILAFVAAFFWNFSLQKFWVFGGVQSHSGRRQIVLFFSANMVNLTLNSFGMYLLVDVMSIWYMAAQVFLTACLAVISFFVYRSWVFKIN